MANYPYSLNTHNNHNEVNVAKKYFPNSFDRIEFYDFVNHVMEQYRQNYPLGKYALYSAWLYNLGMRSHG